MIAKHYQDIGPQHSRLGWPAAGCWQARRRVVRVEAITVGATASRLP
ncbi:hypothetical protein [Streptomyces sp. NPDC046984]